MINPFVLDKARYVREIDPINQYVSQATTFLQIMTGEPEKVCLEYVRDILRNKRIPGIVDPKVEYLSRKENGDREKLETTLMGYIGDSIKQKQLIAPTLTTYCPVEEKESLLVNYVDDNVAARGVAKKLGAAAKHAGKKDLAAFKDIEQTGKKLSNNAVSGAHVSASTPLFNRTAHSTLTSTCRSTSGYGNANNEKFLSGNRHYWSPDIVINNIISVITHTDYKQFVEIVAKYNLRVITPEETMSCITYSTDLYWSNKVGTEKIKSLVDKLTDIQRQAFIYTGDMYHLMMFNQDLVREFLDQLITKVTGNVENALEKVRKFSDDNLNLAHHLCANEMKGKGKRYDEMAGTPELMTLVLTAQNITDTVLKYSDMIQGLWVTDNMPASVAYFPESIRRSALTSDTDSTIFTVQDWVVWYNGSIGFNDKCKSVAGAMIYLASQTITHLLAKMSANFGVEKKRLHQIAMKNEYYFDVFTPTQVAKHYYAGKSIQEGNVYDKMQMEIKGVHLKSSNAPAVITKQATTLMQTIVNKTIAGEKLKILEILKEVGDTERTIKAALLKGEEQYFRLAQIKTASSYTTSERSSPYGHHLFWNEVFGPRYGMLAEPPYGCIKVSTILLNPTDLKNWVDTMVDKELSQRIQDWIVANGKKSFPTIFLASEIVQMHGIPAEIASIIDTRTMVADLSKIFYIILETLGIYLTTDKNTRLIMDTH